MREIVAEVRDTQWFDQGPQPAPTSPTPPFWLVVSTALLALTCLVLAIAETTVWIHFLVDRGEVISLVGLAFITIGGLHLYRTRRLLVSLPLTLPWLLYPVITQGDQLIDNLTINQMRVVCQILLALLFGAPVLVIVVATLRLMGPRRDVVLPRRHWTNYVPGLRPIAEGDERRGAGMLAAALFLTEIWIAHVYLGTLMVTTVVVMALGALGYASSVQAFSRARARSGADEKRALSVLLASVAVSLGLFVGFHNRPGAYQGSPSYYMDPRQKDAAYSLEQIAVPGGSPVLPDPETAGRVREALTGYAGSLQHLVNGYYIADRNYNYMFHNALFLRHTPILPDFRRVALAAVGDASRAAAAADVEANVARSRLAADDPLRALLDDVEGYVVFNLRRAAILEHMSEEFARTEAGFQHATHLYEGEGKMLGVRLTDILVKHRAVTGVDALAPVTGEFLTICRAVTTKYSSRIVGF